MPFMLYEIVAENKARVTLIHNRPDMLPADMVAQGLEVEELPTVDETLTKKEAVLYVNPATKETWYEYQDRPLTPEEQLQADMGTILFESAMDKARIAELEAAQGDMLVEIAMLKMGGNM
jgi:hypothetical protein